MEIRFVIAKLPFSKTKEQLIKYTKRVIEVGEDDFNDMTMDINKISKMENAVNFTQLLNADRGNGLERDSRSWNALIKFGNPDEYMKFNEYKWNNVWLLPKGNYNASKFKRRIR